MERRKKMGRIKIEDGLKEGRKNINRKKKEDRGKEHGQKRERR